MTLIADGVQTVRLANKLCSVETALQLSFVLAVILPAVLSV